jgi:hypothetical protein
LPWIYFEKSVALPIQIESSLQASFANIDSKSSLPIRAFFIGLVDGNSVFTFRGLSLRGAKAGVEGKGGK